MSNADYGIAYCGTCQECHLNGICPKSRINKPIYPSPYSTRSDKEIIDLCDKYLPMAKEIGDDNTVKIFNNKRKMANDMFKALKLDIDKLK